MHDFKSDIIRVISKSNKSKMKLLEFFNEDDKFIIEVPFGSIVKPANHYAVNLKVTNLTQHKTITVSQGNLSNAFGHMTLE